MGGGLMQLVAYGAQDIYLTGNPQITFFKVVYRRHTNFSMETIQQTINGSSQLSAASTSTGTVTVSRNGDLLSSVYVRCDQDTTDGVSGDKLINEVQVEIGGQQVDKQTNEYMNIMNELKTPVSKAAGLKYMTGGFSNALVTAGGTSQQSIMVPLQLWFCNNPGLALPLIALQYHEVKLKFTWNSTNSNARDNGDYGTQPTVEVWCDYIYLDTEERRRFAQVSHEYLIEQVQTQSEGTAAQKYKMNFNHPVKELIWTDADAITTEKVKITLNGHDRLAEQDREYYQLLQPMRHHTSVPGFNVKESERPQMLASPITLTGESELNSVVAGAAAAVNLGEISVTVAGVVTFRTATDPGTLSVGDVLSLSYPTSAGEQTNHMVNVTAVTTQWADATTICSITVNQTGTDVAVSAAGDGAGYIVARAQDPKSNCSQLARNVSVYSFALKPEEHQPSGTCNFSRIDTAYLQLSSSAQVENIYAINYNVLRIMSGMGGLAYSN
jgi:hypothetical protein